MNGVEILSSKVIYNTILPECCIGIGLGFGIIFCSSLFCILGKWKNSYINNSILVCNCVDSHK